MLKLSSACAHALQFSRELGALAHECVEGWGMVRTLRNDAARHPPKVADARKPFSSLKVCLLPNAGANPLLLAREGQPPQAAG